MANQKISQMPAASALTGAEIVEADQAGGSVQTPVSSLGAFIALPPALIGGSNSQLGTFGMHVSWGQFSTTGLTAPTGTMNCINSNTFGAGILLAQTNTTATQQPFNGAGGNLSTSCQMTSFATSAVANQGCWLSGAGTVMGITGAQSLPFSRGMANGTLVSGFTMTAYFSLNATNNVEQLFFGFYGQNSAAVSNTTVPSTLLNSIGLGRDSADTNLQFMINNNSGTAAKTDLGVTHTALAGNLLRLVITCDAFGNCTITLTNVESGGLMYTISYPTTTAKLPVPLGGPGMLTSGSTMGPLLYVNNGGQASSVSFKFQYLFLTTGPAT